METNELLSAVVMTVVQVVLAAALPVLLTYLAKWLAMRVKEVKAGLTDQQLYTLQLVASVAVQAAEQMALADLIEQEGAKKKEWATQYMDSVLRQYGIQVDWQVIEGAIEAAVLQAKAAFDAEMGL